MAGETELFFMGLTLMGVGAVLGIMAGFVWNKIFFPRRWPIDVVIYEQRGKNIVEILDYGAVINKNNEYFKLFLKNKKTKTKPIPFKYMQIGAGGRSVVNLFSPNREEFFAVTPNLLEGGKPVLDLNVLLEDSKYWFALAQREAEQKWKQPPSFMEKWGGILLIGVIGVLIIALIYFGGQHLVNLANSGVSQAKQTAADTQILDQLKALLQGGGGTTPTPAPSPTPPVPSPPVG